MPDISSSLNGFRALSDNLIPFLLTSASVVAGLVMIYTAIRKLYSLGKQGHYNAQGPTMFGIGAQLLLGGLMLRLGATMQDVSVMLFGSQIQDIRGVMAYAPLPAQAGFWKQVLEVVLLWVLMLGWMGAFQGLLLWHKGARGGDSGQSGDYYWRGFWHILGGAAAVNLTGMLQSFFGK
ncbi:hypothetical protein [Ramlibacter sp. AN1133]|uniref:hypothetical protein n=1 Tax=Ramlibacter sp. AN1133 TaxID=3133429 RepID=UPI0030C40C01